MHQLAIVSCLVMLAEPSLGATLAPQQAAAPTKATAAKIRVVSARRAEEYSATGTVLRPRRSDDLVLVVDIAGVSIEKFQALQKAAEDKIFLSAGDQRYEPSTKVSGAWQESDGSVKEERLIVVIVPRSTLSFKLHFVDSGPVAFTADKAIVPKLP